MVIGLALAQTAERNVKITADAATRTKLMVSSFFPSVASPPAAF
jgi:hypothetical protein